MERPVITALADLLRRHVDLSKSRRETMALLTVGMIGARTVNLVHVADERGSDRVDPASTYRRLQRFFQHVRLPGDWAAPMIARLAGGAQKRTLVMDRTNWKIGEAHVNILVLAIRTRHSQVPLMWTVLGRAGHSETPDRIALMERYATIFGRESIAMLLADREFVGENWFNWLIQNDIPFTIRIAHNRLVTRADGCRVKLATQITNHKRGRHCTATLDGMARPLHFAALKPKDGDWVITATNRAGHDALATYRKRWAIESLFGNTKTRGLNFEDTRLTDPAKLHLLTALVALAVAWSVRAARTHLGQDAPPRKTHGYLARSYFRTGFTFLRNRLRSDHPETLVEWNKLPKTLRKTGVV
jgi:Transposase DDE domain